MSDRTVNLREEMEASSGRGLRFEVARQMAVDMKTGHIRGCWAMEISRGGITQSGRPSKGVVVMRLIADNDKGPSDLLRQAAELYDYGNVPVAS